VDVLDPFEQVRVCTGYDVNGTVSNRVPALVDDFLAVHPVYESVEGWSQDITGARVAADLPENARNYLRRLEQLIGAPVTMAGVGPAREQLVPLTDNAAILGGTVAR
jgi:adenylosuccinate synthase